MIKTKRIAMLVLTSQALTFVSARRELAEQCAALLTVSGRGEWTAAGSRPRRTDRRLLRPAPPRRPPPPEIPGDPDLIIE